MSANLTGIYQNYEQYTPYYVLAFQQEYSALWQGTDFEGETDNLSYYQALSAFYSADAQSIADRRKLLYRFLTGEWRAETAHDTLNRVYKQLPVQSVVARTVRNMTNLYSEPPQRTWETSETQQELLQQLYSDIDADFWLREAHRHARLSGVCAMRYYKTATNDVRWQLLTPSQFRVKINPNDSLTIDELWIPYAQQAKVSAVETNGFGTGTMRNDYMAVENTIFHVWTAEEFRVYDRNMNLQRSEVNPYGRIPFVFVRTGSSNDFYTGGMMELVDAQMELNKLRLISNLSATWDTETIKHFVNLNLDQQGTAALRAGAVLVNNEVLEQEGAPIPPEVRFYAPDGSYTEVDDLRKQRERETLRNQGLPESMIADGASVQSGISRVIERLELTEIRKDDIVSMRRAERELSDLIALVENIDGANTRFSVGVRLSVDYAEQSVYIPPAEEYELDRQKVRDYVMSEADFIRKWGGVEGNIADSDIVDRVAQYKEINAEIKGAPEQVAEPEQTDAETDDTQGDAEGAVDADTEEPEIEETE